MKRSSSSKPLKMPAIRLSIGRLTDNYDLGAEFFLWEFATAFAAWRLKINPFDQPNVQESKDATRALLEVFQREGKLPEQSAIAGDGTLTVYGDERLRAEVSANATQSLWQMLSDDI